MADFLSETEWHDLLREIHDQRVIPIVGPELVTMVEPISGRQLPLVQALAPLLAAALRVPMNGNLTPSISSVACQYLLSGGPKMSIYREVCELLDHLRAPPPPALCDLASITDFDLYIAGTIDHLLDLALEQVRPGFRPDERHVLAYSYSRPIDVPEQIGKGLVYHLVGNRRTYPELAVWEEDYLEFFRGLILHHAQLQRLFLLLRRKYLLLLGMPFDDWLVRFFLFVAKGGRFSDHKKDDVQACLTDRIENLGEPLVFFFDKVVGTTRIVRGDPAEFTRELAARWRDRYAGTATDEDVLAQMPDDMPREAVFISYSREDIQAVTRLVRELRANQVPVWVDKERLRTGENFERGLEGAVKFGCSFFVSVISRATERALNDSQGNVRFVHRERRWAAQRHADGFVFYIPVVIDETPLPTVEPAEFANIQFVRLPGGQVTDDFVARLRGLVQEFRLAEQPRG